MVKVPVIVGVDPGTTSGYAILDIDGNLLAKGSVREIGLSEIISRVISTGLPILIGTDKAKVPDFIAQFAAKTGARIAAPKEDLKVDEKRQFVLGYETKDSHESDALASAVFAYNLHNSLIRRIKRYAEESKKTEILNELMIYVIKEEIPIRDAVLLIEGTDEDSKTVKKVIEERSFQKKDFLFLYTKLERYEKENSYLKDINRKLFARTTHLEEEVAKISKSKVKTQRIDAKRIDTLFTFKEKRLSDMENKIKAKEEEIKKLKSELEKSLLLMSKMSKNYLLKKLCNLGINEFLEKNKVLNISQGDILFVDDPNVFNEKTLKFLNDRIWVVVYRVKPAQRTVHELNSER